MKIIEDTKIGIRVHRHLNKYIKICEYNRSKTFSDLGLLSFDNFEHILEDKFYASCDHFSDRASRDWGH